MVLPTDYVYRVARVSGVSGDSLQFFLMFPCIGNKMLYNIKDILCSG